MVTCKVNSIAGEGYFSHSLSQCRGLSLPPTHQEARASVFTCASSQNKLIAENWQTGSSNWHEHWCISQSKVFLFWFALHCLFLVVSFSVNKCIDLYEEFCLTASCSAPEGSAASGCMITLVLIKLSNYFCKYTLSVPKLSWFFPPAANMRRFSEEM